MSRDLLSSFTPTFLLIVQLCASVIVLLLISWANPPWRFAGQGIGKAALAGILEPGLTYAVGLFGLSMTTASSASLISACEPIFIVLVAWILLRQRPTLRLIMAIVVAVIGLLMVSGDALSDTGTGATVGDGLVALATIFAASYVVVSSLVSAKYPAAALAAAQQVVGLIFAMIVLCGVMLSRLERPDLSTISAGALTYAAISGVVQYALAFWLYLVGLRYLAPGVVGLWLTLVPIFGVAGSYLWLGERPTAIMLAGGVLILLAILIGRSEE